MVVMSPGGLGGVADVDPYGIQWQVRRRPVPARFTAPELLPQCLVWGCTRGGGRHAVNSGRDGAPPAKRRDLSLQDHGKANRGCGRPPFEGSAR
jgi:hypothetical protein